MQPYRNIRKGQRCDLLGPPHPSDRLGFCQHLENFPQAFTQLALISTATYLDRVLSGKDDLVWRWHLSIKIVPCSGRVVLRALQNTQLSRESRFSSKPPRLQEMANPVKDHTLPIPSFVCAQPLKNDHAFYKNHKPESPSELIEYDFETAGRLQ